MNTAERSHLLSPENAASIVGEFRMIDHAKKPIQKPAARTNQFSGNSFNICVRVLALQYLFLSPGWFDKTIVFLHDADSAQLCHNCQFFVQNSSAQKQRSIYSTMVSKLNVSASLRKLRLGLMPTTLPTSIPALQQIPA